MCQLSLFACVVKLLCFCLLLSGLIRVRHVVSDLSLYVDYLSVHLLKTAFYFPCCVRVASTTPFCDNNGIVLHFFA